MSGGNYLRKKLYGEGAIFLGGNFPRRQLSSLAIVRWAIIQRAIIQGAVFLGGNYPSI